MTAITTDQILDDTRSLARDWSHPNMRDSLEGARTLALKLLVGSGLSLAEAKAAVDGAIEEGRR